MTVTAALIASVAGGAFELQQHHDELERFLDWALAGSATLHHVIEIGTGHGGLSSLFGRISTGRVISIDAPSPVGMLRRRWCQLRNQQLHVENPRFVGLIGDSTALEPVVYAGHMRRPAYQRVADELRGDLADMLFIDGGHDEQTVWADLRYAKFVKPCGVVAMHDIASPTTDVPQVWRYLVMNGLTETDPHEFVSGGRKWGGIGAWRRVRV